MSKGRSDISNFAIRAFLTRVGHRYDEVRGFSPFKASRSQMREILAFFNNCCCYCGKDLGRDSCTKDHLIPLNKASCGLHAWGNVVPSCSLCNAAKHNRPWQEFLRERHSDAAIRTRFEVKIREFVQRYAYQLSMSELGPIADNLYEDVGAVAMALIENRFRQASNAIEQDLNGDNAKKLTTAAGG